MRSKDRRQKLCIRSFESERRQQPDRRIPPMTEKHKDRIGQHALKTLIRKFN